MKKVNKKLLVFGLVSAFLFLLSVSIFLYLSYWLVSQSPISGPLKSYIEVLVFLVFDEDEESLDDSLKAFAKMEDKDKYVAILNVAFLAYRDGEHELADDLAMQSFALDKKFSHTMNYRWMHGNVIHDAHTILGLTALKRGEKRSAAAHLLDAGKTTGSPQLNSFGPTMILAEALVEAGERAAVIEYLESCKKFWKLSDGQLDSWIAAIRRGGNPDFGLNLRL